MELLPYQSISYLFHCNPRLALHQTTQTHTSLKVKQLTFWNVDNLYLIIGGLLGVSSFGYVYYYIIDRKFEYQSLAKVEDIDYVKLTPVEEEKSFDSEEEIIFSASKTNSTKLSRRKKLIFILLMTSFNFFFAGVEGSFKNYIPAFGSQCDLNLSRQGTELETTTTGIMEA